MTGVDYSSEHARWREVGSWSLAYLGPGFQVHLRVARGRHGVRIDGFMTPFLPVTVLLIAVQTGAAAGETSVGESGRFEISSVAIGAVRLMFVGFDGERRFLTPPFWI